MKKCIVGTGGFARCICDALIAAGQAPTCFLVDMPRAQKRFMGYEVVPEQLFYGANTDAEVYVGIGDEWLRQQYISRLCTQFPHLTFPSVIHPAANVAESVSIGDGVVILAGARVAREGVIEEHAVICPRSQLNEGCRVGAYGTVGPAAELGALAAIGQRSFVGLRARIEASRSIGADCVVGALGDVAATFGDGVVLVGQPARAVRVRQPGPRFF